MTEQILDIGIAFHGQWNYLETTIKSIQKNTKTPYRLILIEDGITEPGREKIKELLLERDPDTGERIGKDNFHWESFDQNHGVAWAWNEILKHSTAPYLCIMNSDVYCFPGWDEPLINALKRKEVGTAGPCTNYAANRQRIFHLQMPLDVAIKKWPATSEALIKSNNGSNQISIVQNIGFCFMMRRKVWKQIGWFDERFCPAFAEETDYCYRAKDLGFECIWVLDSYVHHFGSKTVGNKNTMNAQQIIKRSLSRFKEKRAAFKRNEPMEPICHLAEKKNGK